MRVFKARDGDRGAVMVEMAIVVPIFILLVFGMLEFDQVTPTILADNECWWRIDYNYVGLVKDTTTWTACINGNPIRLVE